MGAPHPEDPNLATDPPVLSRGVHRFTQQYVHTGLYSSTLWRKSFCLVRLMLVFDPAGILMLAKHQSFGLRPNIR